MATNHQATLICNQIHNLIQDSGLHFVINQTPHSSYITIRKRFMDPGNPPQIKSETAESKVRVEVSRLSDELEKANLEMNRLEEEVIEKEEAFEIADKINKDKLENLHVFCDKLSKENVKLKDTIATLHVDISKSQSDLSNSRKSVKVKEKEVHNLTTKFENSQEVVKNLKTEKNQLKREKVDAENELKKVKKKVINRTSKKSEKSQTDPPVLTTNTVLDLNSNSSIEESVLATKPLLNLNCETLEVTKDQETSCNVETSNLFSSLVLDVESNGIEPPAKPKAPESACSAQLSRSSAKSTFELWKCELCETTLPGGYTFDQFYHMREHESQNDH